ncbi:AraC family transcriptional regulator [Seonamhaeicola sp.]|uniref:helix-turn-helix domain-containing protein n=1 Tax=Seonamhaeicola sp. TaxID=1912245 RepID=UPI002614789B|nr:AraC family transcriptional regulator [Seonamhaeicola sp.]
MIFIQISKFEKQNKAYNNKLIRPDIKWLKGTLSIILIFTFLWAYLTIRNNFFTNGETIFYSLWVAMAAIIYWLGHIGIYKYGVLVDRRGIRRYAKNASISANSQSKNGHIIALENLLIKNKTYLDPQLTLESVANSLDLSPSYLSRVINNELKTSFTDYINSYRVEAAKTYLRNPDFSNYTMVSIGMEAGFNSKSAFYEVFKKTTGKTPLAFKRSLTK